MNTLLIFTSACSLSAGFVKYIHRNLDKCINSIWKHENFPKYPLGFFPTKRCFFTSLSIKILPTSNDQFRGFNSVAGTRKQSTNICQILIYNFKIKIYLVFKVNMRCYKYNKRTGEVWAHTMNRMRKIHSWPNHKNLHNWQILCIALNLILTLFEANGYGNLP